MNTLGISRFVSPRLHIVTVSPGGSGTTLLMDFLAARCATNDAADHDGLKHFPGPLLPLNPRCRVLYIYGDPVDMCLSLFRRGYASAQSLKLARGLRGASAPVRPDESIEEYAAAGEDRLGLKRHFESWLQSPRPYAVGFIRYDRLWRSLPNIFRFVGLPPELAQEFPRQIKRHSASHLSPLTKERIAKIYEPLRREMSGLSDFHLSPATPGLARWRVGFGLALRALAPSLSWELSCRLPGLHRHIRRLFGHPVVD